jgi:hypothetical protein
MESLLILFMQMVNIFQQDNGCPPIANVTERAGDDCADMTCYNPGSPKLPVIHRYDCASTKFNPLTGRVIRKVPVPVCK